MPSDRVNRSVLTDIARMWRYARAHGMVADIKALHRPVLWRSVIAAAGDWAMIFAAFGSVLAWGAVAVPFALVIIGNRQRALGNLLHDAAHGTFGRRKVRTDHFARWVLFWPMFISIGLYRSEHFAHHRLLGQPGHDADLIHREEDMGRPWVGLLWRHVSDRRTWIASTLGHLLRAPPAGVAMMLLWWGGFLFVLSVLLTPVAALLFALLWLVSRATVFHLITTFREIADHVGLRPGTVIGFSRNSLAGGLLGWVFHPHANGYHLLHHLDPAIPFHALPRAHALLLAWPDYAAATHCGHYFFGESALVRSWVRLASGPVSLRLPD